LISIFKFLGPSPKELLTTAVVSKWVLSTNRILARKRIKSATFFRQWYRLSFDQKVWEVLFFREESHWNSLVSIHGEKQDLGKKLLTTGSKFLQSIFKTSDVSIEEDEPSQSNDWRKTYIKQYIHNIVVGRRIQAHVNSIRKNVVDNENYAFVQPLLNPWEMKSPFSESVRNPFTKKVFRVPMFGEVKFEFLKKKVENPLDFCYIISAL